MYSVGDLVVVTNNCDFVEECPSRLGKVYKILEKRFSTYDLLKSADFCVEKRNIELAKKDTKLNRKLYPSYQEYKGYLIAPETADKIKLAKKKETC